MGGGTPWWGTVLVAAITAAAALGGQSLSTWRQNRRARREEWFRRVQWAEGLTAADSEQRRAAGYRALQSLSSSPMATPDDLQLLLQLVDNNDVNDVASVYGPAVDDTDFVLDTGDEQPPPVQEEDPQP